MISSTRLRSALASADVPLSDGVARSSAAGVSLRARGRGRRGALLSWRAVGTTRLIGSRPLRCNYTHVFVPRGRDCSPRRRCPDDRGPAAVVSYSECRGFDGSPPGSGGDLPVISSTQAPAASRFFGDASSVFACRNQEVICP